MNNSFFKRTLLMTLTLAIGFHVQAQRQDPTSSIKRGQDIYTLRCLTCHMATGEGVPTVYPSLVKNKNVLNKSYLAQSILKGQRGSIDGKTWSGEMPPQVLTDEQVADVMNYVRNNFGNKAPVVLPKEVQPALKVAVKGFQAY
jgi:mono/diheme cytochrome c family protein